MIVILLLILTSNHDTQIRSALIEIEGYKTKDSIRFFLADDFDFTGGALRNFLKMALGHPGDEVYPGPPEGLRPFEKLSKPPQVLPSQNDRPEYSCRATPRSTRIG